VFGKESCQYLCLEILYLLVFGILELSIEFYMQLEFGKESCRFKNFRISIGPIFSFGTKS
jgi:hypothetical protein